MHRHAYDIANAYQSQGIREIAGPEHDDAIMFMLTLDNTWPESDETPWCSGFVNLIAFNAGLERTKSLLARSWLNVGAPVDLSDAQIGNDVVILKRGSGSQPGPENTTAPGHVGFYAGHEPNEIYLLGGNQGDAVNIRRYPINRLLGIRRLS